MSESSSTWTSGESGLGVVGGEISVWGGGDEGLLSEDLRDDLRGLSEEPVELRIEEPLELSVAGGDFEYWTLFAVLEVAVVGVVGREILSDMHSWIPLLRSSGPLVFWTKECWMLLGMKAI